MKCGGVRGTLGSPASPWKSRSRISLKSSEHQWLRAGGDTPHASSGDEMPQPRRDQSIPSARVTARRGATAFPAARNHERNKNKPQQRLPEGVLVDFVAGDTERSRELRREGPNWPWVGAPLRSQGGGA